MSVTVRTPKLNKWQRNLKTKVPVSLMYAGTILSGKIVKAWLSGKAPNGQSLKKGTEKYLKYKRSKGRGGKIDFNFSGKLQDSFTVKRLRSEGILLYFNSSIQREIARGLYEKRKNMLRIGKKLRAETVNNFFKRLKK